jgi:hypothetical protein
MPILADDGRSLGTFVIGYRDICSTSRFDPELAGFGARLTALILDKSRHLPIAPRQPVVAQAAE